MTLFAFVLTAFSAVFQPAAGGELAWTKHTSSTPIELELNQDPACTIYLESQESQAVADLMIAVVDDDHPGKEQPLVGGFVITVRNLGGGDVRLSTGTLSSCRVSLRASEDEPEKVIARFIDAAAA